MSNTYRAFVVGAMMLASFLVGCGPSKSKELNVGFIGPLSGNAVDLGLSPSKAIALAIREYNKNRGAKSPKVNFFVEDDGWDGRNAVPLYDKLRSEHAIEILFMSHSDGTIALQEKILGDNVLLINAVNNDELLASMNENTFVVGKKTEEAAQVVGARVVELGKKRVGVFYVTNSFMTISAEAFAEHLKRNAVDVILTPVDISLVDYRRELEAFREAGCDAIAFFGYKNLGYAMKQARSLGLDVPFFASTTTLGEGYFENSEGAMSGTEFSFFTANDGNYILAKQFLEKYNREYFEMPSSVWPPMQAYDAANLVLRALDRGLAGGEPVVEQVRHSLLDTNYYQGVCGNLAIKPDGSSRGIYFSLYVVRGQGKIEKVKR